MTATFAAVIGLGLGCNDDSGGSDGSATDGSVTDDTGTDDCEPGQEGCRCVEPDLCSGSLACVGGKCVDPAGPGDTGGNGGDDGDGDDDGGTPPECVNDDDCDAGETCQGGACRPGGGDDGGTDDGGTPADSCDGRCGEYDLEAECQCDAGCYFGDDCCDDFADCGICGANAQCALDEVCHLEECRDPYGLTYEMTVIAFSGVSCSDGIGDAEVYYALHNDGEWLVSSPNDSCPLGWPDYHPTFVPVSDGRFYLEFLEDDAIDDDYLTTFCWDDGFGSCGAVPKPVLHAGGWYGDYGTNDAYHMKIEFTPI